MTGVARRLSPICCLGCPPSHAYNDPVRRSSLRKCSGTDTKLQLAGSSPASIRNAIFSFGSVIDPRRERFDPDFV